MKRKVSSLVFLLTAISIALGAFGHGSQWPKHVRAFYGVEGIFSAAYLSPFFLLFVVQAVALCASMWLLRR
jgi:hypothetical protein